MKKQYEAVMRRFPGQEWKVRITETGWPTQGEKGFVCVFCVLVLVISSGQGGLTTFHLLVNTLIFAGDGSFLLHPID